MAYVTVLTRITQIILLLILLTNVRVTLQLRNMIGMERLVKNITVINATRDTITVEATFGCTSNCKEKEIVWKLAKVPIFRIENPKRIEREKDRFVIFGLQPNTSYQVWAMGSDETFHRALGLPMVKATTCKEFPEKVNHIHVYEKGPYFIKVLWMPKSYCPSTAYYIRWYEYLESDDYWNDKENNGTCSEGVFVANTTSTQCEDDPETICYTINENITSATRYIVEVFTKDAFGNCSDPELTYLKTPVDYWGGITIGAWCVIVLCFVFAISAVPVVIRMKRRLALQITSKENITFKRSSKFEDSQEDDEHDPEGYLVSNTNDRQPSLS